MCLFAFDSHISSSSSVLVVTICFIHWIPFRVTCSNPLVEYMLNGTAIKEALTNGRNTLAQDCDVIYPGCPLDRSTINGVLNKYLPNMGGSLASGGGGAGEQH